jgi:N-ethylmaleimide reductase
MTIEDIKQTVLDFKTAQKNAIAAGFDGVELHTPRLFVATVF